MVGVTLKDWLHNWHFNWLITALKKMIHLYYVLSVLKLTWYFNQYIYWIVKNGKLKKWTAIVFLTKLAHTYFCMFLFFSNYNHV